MYDGTDGLDVSLTGGVLRLRLARPAKRNSLTDDMVAAFIAAVEAAGHDDAVRAVLVSAEGDHFCSGFDIVGRNAGPAGRPRVGSIQRRLPTQAHRLIPSLLSVQVPVVCAAQGWVAGIGLQLVLAADVAVVADDARLWEPFAERGLTPDGGATWLLPRRIGEVRAREMLLLGRVVSGTEAAAWGMVHRAVAAADLVATAEAVVEPLATGPTVALGLTKWLLHAGAQASLDQQLRNEGFAMELGSRSEDFREGLAAFGEKRPPRFGGR
ncbi:MAG TPA: enoyl-CoA hydratase-related protein [Acidimicrobiales bacterium]